MYKLKAIINIICGRSVIANVEFNAPVEITRASRLVMTGNTIHLP